MIKKAIVIAIFNDQDAPSLEMKPNHQVEDHETLA